MQSDAIFSLHVNDCSLVGTIELQSQIVLNTVQIKRTLDSLLNSFARGLSLKSTLLTHQYVVFINKKSSHFPSSSVF